MVNGEFSLRTEIKIENLLVGIEAKVIWSDKSGSYILID